MKRLFHPLVFMLAVLIVFEEWLWDTLKRGLRHLSALPVVAAFEARLRRLGPWASLSVLLLPATLLFPCKIAALWAMGHHHAVLGVSTLIGAKLIGTSIAAYLLDIVRDSARRLAWFDRFYCTVVRALAWTKAWVTAQPAYRAARTATAIVRARLAVVSRRLGARSRLRRKLQAAKVLAYAMPVPSRARPAEPVFSVSEQWLGVPSANDGDAFDVWAIWPDDSMCPVGIELCRALRQPGGKAGDYVLVHVVAYDAAGRPADWFRRQPPEHPPVSFSRAARRAWRDV